MRRWLRTMATVEALLLIGAFSWVVSGGDEPSHRHGNAPPRQQGNNGSVQRGRQLFVANCASCHGMDARSGCPMVPSLIGVTERMSDEKIIAHARGLANPMCCARHLARLNDGNYRDIVAYLHTMEPSEKEHQSHPNMPMMGGCPMMGDMMTMMGSMGHGSHGGQRQNGRPEATKPFPQAQKVGDLTVTFSLQPEPPRVGENTLQVGVRDAKGQGVTDAQVQVLLSMPTMQMTGPTVTARHTKDGVYIATVPLSMEGAWRAELTLRRPSKTPLSTSFDFLVPVPRSQEPAPSGKGINEEPKNEPSQPPPNSPSRRGGCCG